jgi:hypothetical protein
MTRLLGFPATGKGDAVALAFLDLDQDGSLTE